MLNLLFIYGLSTRRLVDYLLARLISGDVVFPNNLDTGIVVLLNVLCLRLHFGLLLRRVLARWSDNVVSDGVWCCWVENLRWLLFFGPIFLNDCDRCCCSTGTSTVGFYWSWLHSSNYGLIVDEWHQEVHVLEEVVGPIAVSLRCCLVLEHFQVSQHRTSQQSPFLLAYSSYNAESKQKENKIKTYNSNNIQGVWLKVDA